MFRCQPLGEYKPESPGCGYDNVITSRLQSDQPGEADSRVSISLTFSVLGALFIAFAFSGR